MREVPPAALFSVLTVLSVVAVSAALIWLRRLWFRKMEPTLNQELHDHLDVPLLNAIPLTLTGLRCLHYYVTVFLIWFVMILWLHSRDALDWIGVSVASSIVALGTMSAMLRRFRMLKDKGAAVFRKRRRADV